MTVAGDFDRRLALPEDGNVLTRELPPWGHRLREAVLEVHERGDVPHPKKVCEIYDPQRVYRSAGFFNGREAALRREILEHLGYTKNEHGRFQRPVTSVEEMSGEPENAYGYIVRGVALARDWRFLWLRHRLVGYQVVGEAIDFDELLLHIGTFISVDPDCEFYTRML